MKLLIVLWMMLMRVECKTSVLTHPRVELVENIVVNSVVVSLSSMMRRRNVSKVQLMNLNGFEKEKFEIRNENVLTRSEIDREEFVLNGYCLNEHSCEIEVHLLMNDGNDYWIIPIHIVDENDNEGKFRRSELKLRYNEKVLNGYKIPFEGAKDVDEGENKEIEYEIKCFDGNAKCLILFELIILSRSSSMFQYDQLALKYFPMNNSDENEFQLKISTRNKNPLKNKRNDEDEGKSLMINIEIEEKEKEKEFSELIYEFVVLLNSSSLVKEEETKIRIGQVTMINVKSFERIFYQIISLKKDRIEINSLTGELFYYSNGEMIENEVKIEVQASILKRNSSKVFYKKSEVKIQFRQMNFVEQIYLDFSFSKEEKEIVRLNDSERFLIDENVRLNESIIEMSLKSLKYESDEYILSLNNYLNIFSILKKKKNIYLIKIKQKLHLKSIYLLNISLKHQLTQHFLPNLLLQFIIVNHFTTQRTTTISRTTTTISDSIDFCEMNEEFDLFPGDRKEKIVSLKVIKSNLTKKRRNEILVGQINENEKIKIDQCEMSLNERKQFDSSFNYSLCQSTFPQICFDLNLVEKEKNEEKLILTIDQIHLLILIISLTFIFLSFLLIFFVFQLKNVHLCSTVLNKCRFFIRQFGFAQSNEQFSSSSFSSPSSSVKIQEKQIDSMINGECRSLSFQLNKTHLIEEEEEEELDERMISSKMFVLSSSMTSKDQSSMIYSVIQREQEEEEQHKNQPVLPPPPPLPPPRTDSSSSFLQETKQLLDLISLHHHHSNESKLVSQV